MMDTMNAIAAAIALVVSIIVFMETRARERRNTRLARRPVLVFAWDAGRQVWELRNIGNGPALDVVILQHVGNQWSHPLRMPELSVNGTAVVPRRWYECWDKDPGLGACYRSSVDEPYSTVTGNDWSHLKDGWQELSVARKANVEPHWKY